MNYLDEIVFNYFPNNIETKRPLGVVTLRQLIDKIREPRESVVNLFSKIRSASAKGDMKLKAELKSKLFYFTPCVKLDGQGRSYKNVTSWTGLVQIDFDGLTNAEKFRDYLFNTFKSIIFAGVSASGMGVKCLVRIEEATSVEEFKEYFCGLAFYLERFRGFDIAPYNCVLPLYFFIDPDLKWRDDATVSSIKGYKINSVKKFKGDIEDLGIIENLLLEDVDYVKNMFRKSMRGIVDNGHPQVVRKCTGLAGRVSAGYLSLDDANLLIEEAIGKNEYLSKNVNGYIATGKEMLIKGLNAAPLFLEKHRK